MLVSYNDIPVYACDEVLYSALQCCGCQKSNEKINYFVPKFNFTLVDSVEKEEVNVFIVSGAD
jgi:hypothetical protein